MTDVLLQYSVDRASPGSRSTHRATWLIVANMSATLTCTRIRHSRCEASPERSVAYWVA